MYAFLLSFGVIFIAELGDKSQLMALAFASRYTFWTVVGAITAATAVVHLASVAIGASVGIALPADVLNVAAGLAFIGFGIWTLRGDELGEDEAKRASRSSRSVFLSIAGTFMLAELGDKTMLATVTLASNHPWLGTWVGSTLGMVAADALAIAVGSALGRRMPEQVIRIGASLLFFGIGAWLLVEGAM